MEDSSSSWSANRQLSSNVDNASAFLKELVSHLKRLEWSDKDTFAIMIAMEEALMNAVKHGNQYDESKKVGVVVEINGSSFYTKVTDEGKGFDLEQVPDPCDESNLEKSSGRGVALIKSFVDEVQYNKAGNMIEFRKTQTTGS